MSLPHVVPVLVLVIVTNLVHHAAEAALLPDARGVPLEKTKYKRTSFGNSISNVDTVAVSSRYFCNDVFASIGHWAANLLPILSAKPKTKLRQAGSFLSNQVNPNYDVIAIKEHQ